jgi:hypothetical protein
MGGSSICLSKQARSSLGCNRISLAACSNLAMLRVEVRWRCRRGNPLGGPTLGSLHPVGGMPHLHSQRGPAPWGPARGKWARRKLAPAHGLQIRGQLGSPCRVPSCCWAGPHAAGLCATLGQGGLRCLRRETLLCLHQHFRVAVSSTW